MLGILRLAKIKAVKQLKSFSNSDTILMFDPRRGSSNNLIHRKYLGVAQFGMQQLVSRAKPKLRQKDTSLSLLTAWASPYARSALPNAGLRGSSNNLIHRNYLGVAQFGMQ